MVTAKIRCHTKTAQGEGDARQVAVTFLPDYSDGRNKEWSLYTPALSLSMTLKGAVADRFEPDKPYTLQFIEDAAEPQPAARQGMGFGEALALLKSGRRVAREGWNGKGMFVAYQAGYPDGIAINANTAEATGIPQGTVCSFRPYLMLKAADDTFVPWVASQTDILADDWLVV